MEQLYYDELMECYILGYILSVIPLVILQNILFFLTAMLLGLKFNINIFIVFNIGL